MVAGKMDTRKANSKKDMRRSCAVTGRARKTKRRNALAGARTSLIAGETGQRVFIHKRSCDA
ncbi:hypothetical protein CW354_11360 [Marinicaulis flavus]|uniref:Uncharacterized protein n=1 Tax=Hyphococcus luteus TaxID=2058213 RepID=A0A2S7K578_9PROT|nr:hypothetical protein CW354_11360 [Marinicaulis flavus]